MTRKQLASFVSLFMLAGGLAVHQGFRAIKLERLEESIAIRCQSLAQRLNSLDRENQIAAAEWGLLKLEQGLLESHKRELMTLRDHVSRLRDSTLHSADFKTNSQSLWLQSAAKTWVDKMARLKQKLAETPESQIPEMELVSEQEWLDQTKEELLTDEEYHQALGKIRGVAERSAFLALNAALSNYMKAGGRAFPSDVGQLSVYLEKPLSQTIIDRWGVYPVTNFPALHLKGEFVITQKYPGNSNFARRFYFNEKSNWEF